jgi:hypothetical protein
MIAGLPSGSPLRLYIMPLAAVNSHIVCTPRPEAPVLLNILPGRLQTNLVVPVDHQNCRVIFEYFYDDIESKATRRKIDEDIAFADRVRDEDIDIREHVQRGLNSTGYDRGRDPGYDG